MFVSVLMFSLGLNLYFGAVFASAISGPRELPLIDGDEDARIVVLPVDGMIDDDTARFIGAAMRALDKDPPAAIVLRVSSSGGGVGASDRIWHALTEFRDKHEIPIVASFGSVAASGGYYIAAASDHIVAEPTTLTGSIGVISQGFTVQGLLEKVGVTPETISATEATKKDVLNPTRAWTEEDRRALTFILDDAYETFVQVVDNGRPNLATDQVRALATGEIFTSNQAQNNGLVDQEGYLEDAIDKAKQLANIDADVQPYVTVMSPARSLGLLGALGWSGVESTTFDGEKLRRLLSEAAAPRLEYRELRVAP